MSTQSTTQPFRFAAPADGMLTDAMKQAFYSHGVLVLENYLTSGETADLRKATEKLVDAFDPESVRTVFSTDDQQHAADTYFRESGDKIRYFFEKDALDGDGNLVRDKHSCLNKIGHAMHDLDPDFDRLSRTEKLENTARDLGMADPAIAQSMLIFKQPQIGGEVGMHQDATFLHTEPQSVIGFWFALEDATTENGCLFGLPGLEGRKLAERFHYEGDGLTMSQISEQSMPMEDAVALEVDEGALVLLHGLFPHASHPNTSDRSRQAYTLHMVDRAARWSPDNWIKRTDGTPFRGFEPAA